jgi:hypothetical protein
VYTFGYHRHGQLGIGAEGDLGSVDGSEGSLGPHLHAHATALCCLLPCPCPFPAIQVRIGALHTTLATAGACLGATALLGASLASCWAGGDPFWPRVATLGTFLVAFAGFSWCGSEATKQDPPVTYTAVPGPVAGCAWLALLVCVLRASGAAATLAFPQICPTGFMCLAVSEGLWYVLPALGCLLLTALPGNAGVYHLAASGASDETGDGSAPA